MILCFLVSSNPQFANSDFSPVNSPVAIVRIPPVSMLIHFDPPPPEVVPVDANGLLPQALPVGGADAEPLPLLFFDPLNQDILSE